ncbi:MAG: hypothetical protein ABDH18_00890 [Aquificaceae bacterium]
MDHSVNFLEALLFKTQSKEINQRFEELVQSCPDDVEILNIASSIKGLSDFVLGAIESGSISQELYDSLYQALKDLSATLYDLTIAEGEQLKYVISRAYAKLNSANSIVEKLS